MKTYIKFLISLFNISFFKVFFTFFIIILITNILEQVEFFKDINLNFFYLVFLSFLNTPTIIFEILPFIFLISTQVFFIYLIDKKELEIFKYSGLNNFMIIKIISVYTFIAGLIFIIIFYNVSAIMKNSYLLVKNKYSDDNRYLAVITENGLWIKDEIEGNINIINANKMDNIYLLDVSITQFDKNFKILNIIRSKKIDITSFQWKIFEPLTLKNNQETKLSEMTLKSNFDLKKINSLFSNLSSLTMVNLIELRKDYKSLNYSVIDIDSHLYKIITYPIYLTLITVFSAIIMFNIGYNKNSLFKITLGILLSVVIYYINHFLNILGTNEKIPLILSIFMPLIILSIINFISIIRLNEK
ncbi:LptF/LptG family permease [Candidatus Pelagibacter sp. Uisw_136]|uniref:LptF/LptG family permease n=1 Tax=Candidatus Pelagibacter sp. Uisw_136 TaxID=3230991 RepID=UPI0039EA6432